MTTPTGPMRQRRLLSRDGVRLATCHFGGEGQSVVLLHGLAGHAEEWTQTASWLTQRCRVVALDARGHGYSQRLPDDVSPAAQVADVLFVIARLGLPPVVLVGQSLGGRTALSLAAEHPDVVRGLVVVEATPAAGNEMADVAARDIGRALREWPVPFDSRAAAEAFFERRFGPGLTAVAWADGLELLDGCWWPRFDPDVMARTLRATLSEPNWDAWERVSCPTLLIRAGDGMVEPGVATEMMGRQPRARLVHLADAGHDVHLSRPDKWRKTLSAFLDSLGSSPSVPGG